MVRKANGVRSCIANLGSLLLGPVDIDLKESPDCVVNVGVHVFLSILHETVDGPHSRLVLVVDRLLVLEHLAWSVLSCFGDQG